MNKYEILYILKTGLDDAKRDAVVERFGALVTANGGKVASVDKWGTKRFAYPIDYKNDGYYVLMNFESMPEFPKEMERQMRITDEIIRYMVVRKEAFDAPRPVRTPKLEPKAEVAEKAVPAEPVKEPAAVETAATPVAEAIVDAVAEAAEPVASETVTEEAKTE